MMMDSAVLALCFSRDSTLLASGDSDGNVRVWNVQTGATQRRFAKAHAQGITSLRFTRDGAMVLSASFDGNIRLHGLRSGHSLRDFRGHTAFVNDVCFSSDGSRVLSASSDGTLRGTLDLEFSLSLLISRHHSVGRDDGRMPNGPPATDVDRRRQGRNCGRQGSREPPCIRCPGDAERPVASPSRRL